MYNCPLEHIYVDRYLIIKYSLAIFIYIYVYYTPVLYICISPAECITCITPVFNTCITIVIRGYNTI